MMILNQNKARLLNGVTSRKNPDSSPGIYPTPAKLAQCRLVDDNRGEKEDKKGNIK